MEGIDKLRERILFTQPRLFSAFTVVVESLRSFGNNVSRSSYMYAYLTLFVNYRLRR